MQVNPADLAAQATAPLGATVVARVVAGNLTAVPVGELLQATVMQVAAGQATLDVNGQPVTIRPGTGLPPGTVLLARVPNAGANPTLELLGRAPTRTAGELVPGGAASLPPPLLGRSPAEGGRVGGMGGAGNPPPADLQSATSPTRGEVKSLPAGNGSVPVGASLPQPPVSARVAVVDVLSAGGNGPLRVSIDGQTELAVSAEPLAAGGRYVLQVERTPAGLTLRLPPDSPKLATDVAAAVLRAARPVSLGAAVAPLLAELATVPANPAAPNAVQQAAATVREAVRAFVPPDGRPPDATNLQNLVENGGLHHEAKLARELPPDAGSASDTPVSQNPAAARADRASSPDLKEGLMRLLQAAQDIGTAATFPAARAALDGIESQQAANVYAQAQGTPYVLQVPFPDAGTWRTLNLAVEPEDQRGRSASDDKPGGFRLMMHVPLADLGETWIDAGLSGDRFRAVLYLDNAAARDRVRAELPGLRDELQATGFSEVLLDVRPARDLPAKQRRQAAAMTAGRPESVNVLDVKA